jgi:hypothetical protein
LGGAAGATADFSGDAAGAAASGVVILQVCTSCLMFIWAIVLWAVSPAVMIRYAETGQFNAAFQFSEIIDFIKADVGSYVIVMLLMVVASGIIAPLGTILCVVGVIFTQFWAYLVWGNLLGQLANKVRSGGSVAVA